MKNFYSFEDEQNIPVEKRFQHYQEKLKAEIKSRPNKKEINEKIIFSEGATFFIDSYMTTEEHNKLEQELGKDGIWFHPLCSNSEIKRILNPQTSSDILLKKRAEYIVDRTRTRRVFKKRKEIYECNEKVWSLTDYYNRDKHFSKYLNKLKPYVKKRCKLVEAGFVFMTEPNGRCEKTDFGNIIYLSESLSYFLQFMNLSMLTFQGENIGIGTRESLLIGLRVMLGVEALDFDLDPRYDTLPEDVIQANNDLVNYQLMFIVGHEYAHHSLGHLNNSKCVDIASTDNVTKEKHIQKVYNYSQKQEFEADFFSFKNAKLNKDEKTEMLNGAFLFFIYIDIYNYVRSYIFPSSLDKKTHPEPLDRLWKLRRNIKKSIGYSKKELELFIEDAQEYKDILRKDKLPYNPELFESYGSIYLSGYKTKRMIDRIDF